MTATSHPLPRDQLEAISTTDINDAIPADELAAALATPPFIVSPLLNLRDMGHIPGCSIAPGRIYRCAKLGDDEATKQWLSANVTKVFDLRGRREVTSAPDPAADNVQNVWLATEGEHRKLVLDGFEEGDGSPGWKKQYLYIAAQYRPTFRAVLEHLHDSPDDPILFHCTAGRDRTGILAGMLHHLAGTDEPDVLYDYMLSRIGLEPGRDMLHKAIITAWNVSDPNNVAFKNVASIRPTFFTSFVDGINEVYGGWDGYFTSHLGFTETQLERIRSNLRGGGAVDTESRL